MLSAWFVDELTICVDVSGRINEVAQTETPEASLVITKAVAYLPAGVDISTRDRIEQGDVEWEVSGVTNKSLPISAGSYVRVELERVTHGG